MVYCTALSIEGKLISCHTAQLTFKSKRSQHLSVTSIKNVFITLETQMCRLHTIIRDYKSHFTKSKTCAVGINLTIAPGCINLFHLIGGASIAVYFHHSKC